MIKEFTQLFFALGVIWFAAAEAFAADFSVKPGTQPPPDKITEAVRTALSVKPFVLSEGDKPVIQMWFRNDIPLKSKPSSASAALDSLSETTLIGAVSVENVGFTDYKNNDVPKGVYTARFVRQPQDGDHLGTAEYNTFIALLPADVDKALDTFTKYTPMVKASGKLTSSGHPVIISLRPATSAEGEFPAIAEPVPEHKSLRLKVSGKSSEGPAEVPFELVFQGHGHIQ